MNKASSDRIKELLERVARLSASEDWGDNLNPAQRAVLSYLSNANRFSRAPSNIADYMNTTRGTISQTLKALERKKMVARTRSIADKRSISYDVLPLGLAAISLRSDLDAVLDNMNEQESRSTSRSLESILTQVLEKRGNKPFGICAICRHHQNLKNGRFCSLLNVSLTETEASQICHEFAHSA